MPASNLEFLLLFKGYLSVKMGCEIFATVSHFFNEKDLVIICNLGRAQSITF